MVYGSIFALMSVSLTLTYITTKVPNFAQGALVTAGLYTGFALLSINRINPYDSLPLSFLVGGAIAVGMYLLVLSPLARRGAPVISLMIATLAIDIIFIGIFGIYSDYLYQTKKVYDAKLFYALTSADFRFLGVDGVVVVAPLALALVTMGLYLVLTRTRFGLAMRATVENPNLARVVGVNTGTVYVVSWFLAGGLAAVAGVFYSLWQGGEPDIGSILLISMFAGSILGGLKSIYGAVAGGLVVGGSEIIVTTLGAQYIGAWVTPYEPGIPLLVMVVTLLVLPGGITSIDLRKRFSGGKK
ncbi:MAG: branched-chain amino acid ABC transporter permease [Nitrososphaerales archaeon]